MTTKKSPLAVPLPVLEPLAGVRMAAAEAGMRYKDRTDVVMMEVPSGSILVIRATGDARLDVSASGGLTEAARDGAPAPPTGTEEKRYTINDEGAARDVADPICQSRVLVTQSPTLDCG